MTTLPGSDPRLPAPGAIMTRLLCALTVVVVAALWLWPAGAR